MGHAVRVAAVVEELRRVIPLEITVLADRERSVWPAGLQGAVATWHRSPCDAGVVQSDDVTVDPVATGKALEAWLASLPGLVERERERLERGFDLVLGDVPSPAFDAAKRAGIPSFAIANFSWDWIYSELGFPEAARAAAAGYESASLLLEASPSAPMPAFPRRRQVGLVAREPSAARDAARERLGARSQESLVLLAFQPASAPQVRLPPSRPGRRFVVPAGWSVGARTDLRELPDDMGFVDAIAAADVVVGKPGYGLIGDVDAAGARFLYVPRPGFPENAVLERHLEARGGTASLAAAQLAAGRWEDVLAGLEAAEPPRPADAGGAAAAAREIASALGIDSGDATD